MVLFGYSIFSCKQNNSNTSNSSQIKSDGNYTSPDGKASLSVTGNLRILKLNGTNSEMGYNHGYLLGAEIIDLFQRYIIWKAGVNFNDISDVQGLINWDSGSLEELQAMLDGINAALTSDQRKITPLNQSSRDITLTDLKIINSMPDWTGAFLCSSFCIWGAGRSDGSTLLARNLDYFVDPESAVKKRQVVISCNPSSGKKWVSVSVVGFIGCISGINEDGVCANLHDTNAYATTDTTGFVTRGLALRSLIQYLGSSSTPIHADAFLDPLPDYKGNEIDLCFISTSRSDDDIAGILEYDGKADHANGRCTLRSPSLNTTLGCDMALPFTYGIINTNHYLKRKTCDGTGSSSVRYLTIKTGLINALTDSDVNVEEARAIMKSVGSTGTLHTIIMEPNVMRMHIYLSDENTISYDSPGYHYNFSDLF